MKNHYIMDYETIINCFIGSFMHYKTKEIKTFVIHESRNDIKEFLEFLKNTIEEDAYHISFNGLGFDAQISQYILNNEHHLLYSPPHTIAYHIYQFAQSVIDLKNKDQFLPYAPYEIEIKQLDLYLLNHWNNVSKRSSLKWIAYSMDTDNLMDMPHKHNEYVQDSNTLNELIQYCENDIHETNKIYEHNKRNGDIELRKKLSKTYDLNLISQPEPSLAKQIFLKFLSEESGISIKNLKAGRSYRKEINVGDILLPYLDFKIPEFKKAHEKFSNLIIDPKQTKGALKFGLKYKGCETNFGLGGIHGATSSGVFTSTDDWSIESVDVKSFYPNLAIVNNWSPGHIDKNVFTRLYKFFYDERVKIPKSDPINYTYKILLNSVYGLSNEVNSPFYDPLLTMQITINGQLSLLLLYEMIALAIPEGIPLMQNTDGLEYYIPKDKKDIFYDVCRRWERITNLELEFAQYSKMFISDVNSYIAIYTPKEITKEKFNELSSKQHYDLVFEQDNKYYFSGIKRKGRLEFIDLPLHKNKSYKVIKEAVFNYFVHNIMPEQTIKNCTNIFDFCAGVKSKGDWRIFSHSIEKGQEKIIELQKTVRYYNSKSFSGVKLIKHNIIDGRQELLESGPYMQTIYLKHKPNNITEYDINYAYYITKAREEINRIINPNIKDKSLKLF